MNGNNENNAKYMIFSPSGEMSIDEALGEMREAVFGGDDDD